MRRHCSLILAASLVAIAGCQQSGPADEAGGNASDSAIGSNPADPASAGSGDDPVADTGNGGDGSAGSPDRDGQPGTKDCPVIGSSGWKAWENAMPGVGAKRTLIVEGQVRLPSAGYRASLALGEIAESNPLQATVRLKTTAPSDSSAQVITTVDVRGDWEVQGDVGSVTVRCGDRTIARISSVEAAH